MPKDKAANIEILRQIERIEARCRAGHHALHRPNSEEGRQLQTLSVAGASIEVSGAAPNDRIGRVYGFGIFEQATEAGLDAILETLASTQASHIRFRVPPTEQRAAITEWLLRRGMRRFTFVVHWIASTEPARPMETPYEIRPLCPDDSEKFGQLITLHYHLKAPGSAEFHARLEEMPGMKCFLAFDGDRAIGTGATYSEGTGCIVEYGTTLGPYRRQGLQRAMIGYRLNAAAKAGCHWACASTIGSDRSSRNLARQGFEKAFDAPVFTWKPDLL